MFLFFLEWKKTQNISQTKPKDLFLQEGKGPRLILMRWELIRLCTFDQEPSQLILKSEKSWQDLVLLIPACPKLRCWFMLPHVNMPYLRIMSYGFFSSPVGMCQTSVSVLISQIIIWISDKFFIRIFEGHKLMLIVSQCATWLEL